MYNKHYDELYCFFSANINLNNYINPIVILLCSWRAIITVLTNDDAYRRVLVCASFNLFVNRDCCRTHFWTDTILYRSVWKLHNTVFAGTVALKRDLSFHCILRGLKRPFIRHDSARRPDMPDIRIHTVILRISSSFRHSYWFRWKIEFLFKTIFCDVLHDIIKINEIIPIAYLCADS